MVRKWVRNLLFGAALLTSILAFKASAQLLPASGCIGQQQYCPLCGDSSTGFFNCIVEITILDICNVMLPACAPAAAVSETCQTCPAGGHPITLSTGNTFIKQTDIQIPGLGGGLTFVRTWNSLWPVTQIATQVGLFGPNWRSTFEEAVFLGADHYVKYARGDGSFWSFGYAGSVWSLAAPQDVTATLAPGSPYWTITFQNGEKRLFNNTSGSLIAIIDRNGNTTSLSYDATNRLTTVTDAVGRHLYFHYPNDTSHLVSSITSDTGISLSYSYDVQNRLNQVTLPDLSIISFTYNAQSLITAVTDAQGKVLESHSYDSAGRGLTSSRAAGVESITLSYPNP